MLFIILVRIAITLTFFMLAAGGPYALLILRRFIIRYEAAHRILEMRTDALEQEVQALKRSHAGDQT